MLYKYDNADTFLAPPGIAGKKQFFFKDAFYFKLCKTMLLQK